MTKEYIGLNLYYYEFNLKEEKKFLSMKEKLSKTGTITEIFVNNKLAFEYKVNRQVY